MFDMLIGCKKTVSVRCGSNDIVGVISHFYEPFRLLKINNVLLPLELVEHIIVLDEPDAAPYSSRTASMAATNRKRLNS
ncbi:hypothetical protein ACFFK0_16065 [Paenibacillus chartarius]|uniref:DUF2642 domain-containing protein n=1 Tax=Paenibacillus chartarius TaxID=747481 RepID=A0ABV6DMX0_9BACL